MTFRSGSVGDGYSQLGHGGTDSGGDNTGDINVKSRGDVLFAGGSVNEYSQLGHGGLCDKPEIIAEVLPFSPKEI